MAPFLKTYSGTGSFVALESSKTLFRGQMVAVTGTVTLRKAGQTTDSVALATTDQPITFAGVDLALIEISGNGNSLKVSGVKQNGG